MASIGKTGSKYKHTDQERDNDSHDDTWGVNVVEIVGENAAGTALLRVKANADGSLSTGGLTNTELRATPVPVSGTFYQATQPVSGTFYQATQPVSLVSVPSHAVTNAGVFAVQVTGSGASATATGTTVARFTALTNTAQAIKASTGNLYSYHLSNQANPAQDLYVHFYNVAAASVTVGTTTPSRSFFLPGGAVIDTPYSIPMAFGTAISVAVSTTSTGGTAPTNTIYVHAEYA